jgi:hypothetical protein
LRHHERQLAHRTQRRLSEYLTYDWGPPDNLPVGDPRLDNNPFFDDYLQGAIEKKMAAKGFERAVTGTPDLLVHYHASVNQKLDVYEVDNRYGYCYRIGLRSRSMKKSRR